jgi:hypothetical protein
MRKIVSRNISVLKMLDVVKGMGGIKWKMSERKIKEQ